MQNAYHFFDDPQRSMADYRDNGFFMEPNVRSADECDEIVEQAKKLPAFRNGNARPAMQLHKESPFFLECMQHPTIVAILQHLVGGEVNGLQTEFFYGKPGTPGFSAHQDNFFVQAPLDAFASAWLALTDVTPDKGGLKVWEGSHKAGMLPTEENEGTSEHPDQDPNGYKTNCLVPGEYKMLTPSVSKGSVLFIHGCVVHASHQNISDDWRYVLLSTFIRKGAPFRPGRYAKREALSLKQSPYAAN